VEGNNDNSVNNDNGGEKSKRGGGAMNKNLMLKLEEASSLPRLDVCLMKKMA